jgi:DNA polymerase I
MFNAKNCREAITIVGSEIHVDEDSLDIFSYTDKTFPEFLPYEYTPYKDLTSVALDIETSGLKHDDTARIHAIGLKSNTGGVKLLYGGSDNDEKHILLELDQIMQKKNPDLLLTYNGERFDLPYLDFRYKTHGLESPVIFETFDRHFTAAMTAGLPLMANFRHANAWGAQHVDLLYQFIVWDAVARKAPAHTLKVAPVVLGIRGEGDRIELGYRELLEAYSAGPGTAEFTRMLEYLTDDIADTKAVADKLLPALISSQAFIPIARIDQLAINGTGTKWQKVLADKYPKSYVDSLESPTKLKYRGGLTFARAGLFRDVFGVDVSGMYPSVMKAYGLHSPKDPEGWTLSVLSAAVASRNAVKYKKDLTEWDKSLAAGAKPTVNSAYGALASSISFADPETAALVTAYSRRILKFMRAWVESRGCEVILQDTDSCFFTHPKGLGYCAELYKEMQEAMPKGIMIDIESQNTGYFVPPTAVPEEFNKSYRFKSVNGRKFLEATFGAFEDVFGLEKEWQNHAEEKVTFEVLCEISDKLDLGFPFWKGVRKNYIKIDQAGKVTAKGKFNKRNSSELIKLFQPEYFKLLVSGGDAASYHRVLRQSIVDGTCPVEFLQTKTTIATTHKDAVERGLGSVGDKITTFVATGGMKQLSANYGIYDYDVDHYLGILDELYAELNI